MISRSSFAVPTDRATLLAQVQAAGETYDLAIIGGGATGLGAAVEAAARGWRVVLIEQADFAKGTSSRSTKLVHGGVRYLRQGNIGLVHAALHERGRLARNAPHLVRSTGFLIPCYRWWERGFYLTGLAAYDTLSGKDSLGSSRLLDRAAALQLAPTLAAEDLAGGVLYRDGQFDDARLAVTLALTARDRGAHLLNYCACIGVLKRNGRVSGVRTRDTETGREFEIQAKAVINATGAFVDAVRAFDEPAAAPLVTVSRGIHLVVPKHVLPGDTAVMVPKTADGRVFFAVPWHDRVVLGTTDVPVRGATLEPRASMAEVEFLLQHAARHLAAPLRESEICSIYAGVRPLVRAEGGAATSALSRDHSIIASASGLLTITGGKWTTYRKMAADVVARAAQIAGIAAAPSPTEEMRLHGTATGELSAAPAHLTVYGTDATEVQKIIAAESSSAELLHARLPYQQAEVIWQARGEFARTVEDVLARRTRALLLDAAASIEAAPTVARLLAAELGHDAAWVQRQVTDYTALARRYVFADPASRVSADSLS